MVKKGRGVTIHVCGAITMWRKFALAHAGLFIDALFRKDVGGGKIGGWGEFVQDLAGFLHVLI